MASLDSTFSPSENTAPPQPSTFDNLLLSAKAENNGRLQQKLEETLALNAPLDDSQGPQQPLLKAAVANLMAKPETYTEKHVALKEGATEFVSSLSAGVVGTVALSIAAAYCTHNYARALTIPLALAAGGLTKYAVKDAGEHLLLDKKDRTLSSKDLLWGTVDAAAGIGASAVEGQLAKNAFTNLGRQYLGMDVARSTAFDAGKIVAKESLAWGSTTNTLRAMGGGIAGAAIWSAPHRLVDNWQEISKNPAQALKKTAMEIASDSAKGAVIGGVMGLGGTVLGRQDQVLGKTMALINPEKNVFLEDIYHLNDFHSNTEQLPRIKTILDERMRLSAARGADARFVIPGDAESGRVNFAFTRGGEIENTALVRMGAKVVVPGNHPYDAPGGRFDIPRYPAMMEPILRENPDVSLISANLDVSHYPQYQKLLKPFNIREVQTKWGPAKIAEIGLTTEEGALGQIKFNEALPVTINTINALRKEGVSIFEIYSHLGLGEDIKLAQGLIASDTKVAGIVGAHTHDALPKPYWVGPEGNHVRNMLSQLPFLRFLKPGGFEIPITQAGHSGQWLGEVNKAITPDGLSVRYQTTSHLHPVTADIAEDAQIRQYLDENVDAINDLKKESFEATATSSYNVAESRNRETPIGNLYADALLTGLKKRLVDDAPDAVLVHSGGIRSGLPANRNLTRLDVANIVMNAGDKEGEKKELALMNLTGAQLKNAIEYGVRERAAEPSPSLSEQIRSLFVHEREELVDEPGNFVQVSDNLKYTYDASKAPLTPEGGGQRVVDLQIKNASGQFEPVDPDKTYKIAARFHPLDKWTKFKMFGDKTIDEVQKELGVKPLPYSQVDLIGEFIANRTLDPNVDSAVTGRITDLTPKASAPSLRPGKSLFVAPAVAAFDGINNLQGKGS